MWKNFFFAVMGLAFGVYICAIGFVEVVSDSNAPTEHQTSPAHGEQIKAQSSPLGRLANARPSDNRANSADEKEGALQPVLGRINSFLFDIKITDVLLVLFTWLLADKTRGLFVETAGLRTAADQQKVDLLRSIEAAERTATAAETTVAKMEDTAERQLRAYVHVETAAIRGIASGIKCHAQLIVKNFGQTPAHDVVAWIAILTNVFPAPDGTIPVAKQDWLNNPTRILSPNGSVEYDAVLPNPLNDVFVAALNTGQAAIYVIGEVSYRDVFGRSHITIIRYFTGGTAGIKGDQLADYEGIYAD